MYKNRVYKNILSKKMLSVKFFYLIMVKKNC